MKPHPCWAWDVGHRWDSDWDGPTLPNPMRHLQLEDLRDNAAVQQDPG